MSASRRVLGPFERLGPISFIIGGIGLLGTTVVGSLDVGAIVQSPPRLAMGPLLFGLWFVFVGLIGFYPYVSETSSRLSLAGVWTAGIAWIIWTVTLLMAVIVDLTSSRTFADPGGWGPPLLSSAFVLALLSFLVYGLATTQSHHPSRILAVLLYIPVIAFLGQAVLLVSKILTGDVIAILQLMLGGLSALALIVIGYRLQTRHEPPPKDGAHAGATA